MENYIPNQAAPSNPIDDKNSLVQSPRKPFFFSKLFILIIVFVILVSGSAGAYFFLNSKNTISQIAKDQISPSPKPASPTPADKTANWTTYSNNKYNYSIKYPSNLLIERKIACPENYNFPEYVSLNLYDKKNHECLPDIPSTFMIYVNQDKERPSSSEDKCYTVEKKQTIINGLEAEEYTTYFHFENDKCRLQGINPGSTKDVKIFITKNDTVFVISYSYEKEVDRKNFEGMVSTFKFCKPRPACLDTTPRCMIPETSDMCPKPTN